MNDVQGISALCIILILAIALTDKDLLKDFAKAVVTLVKDFFETLITLFRE